MKIKMMAALAVPVAIVASCKDDAMDVKFTDKGPSMTIVSCAESAFMGDSVRFSVTLDDEFPLSTLKADLLFDGTSVGDVTIRTKENGTYDAAVGVPLLASIPDGTAELAFAAQNTGLGLTYDTVYVKVSRPQPETMTLTVDGKDYTMQRTGDYSYSVVGDFPADASAIIECVPASGEEAIHLGWDGSALKVVSSSSSSDQIPFAAVKDGTYEISVDLMDLTASPFGSLSVALTETGNELTVNLLQGTSLEFPGISDITSWDLDCDFFTLNADNSVTFNSVDGLYKLVADYGSKFIKVEAMKDASTTASLADDGTGAVWAIGSGLGKPAVGPSWNTTDGAWCFSQVEDKVYQLTLTAGVSLSTSGLSIKFFHQKGWGGEFASYSAVNDETGKFTVTSSGNIELQSGVKLTAGTNLRFTVDVTGGVSAATLTIKEVELAASSLDIKVNGTAASRLSATHYQVASIALEKDAAITITGIDDLSSWYLDPDFLYLDGSTLKFNVVSGTFQVDLYLDYGYATFIRLAADGSEATITDGALWMMAWGLANPVMTSQFAFNPGSAFCMAQVSPLVFQLTGTAVEETDGTTLGGRFRYDYISAKWFGQDGWGLEKGKIFGDATTISYTGLAATMLTDEGSVSNNISLVDGQQLELGATYVLTIDLSQTAETGVEVVNLEKK